VFEDWDGQLRLAGQRGVGWRSGTTERRISGTVHKAGEHSGTGRNRVKISKREGSSRSGSKVDVVHASSHKMHDVLDCSKRHSQI